MGGAQDQGDCGETGMGKRLGLRETQGGDFSHTRRSPPPGASEHCLSVKQEKIQAKNFTAEQREYSLDEQCCSLLFSPCCY